MFSRVANSISAFQNKSPAIISYPGVDTNLTKTKLLMNFTLPTLDVFFLSQSN